MQIQVRRRVLWCLTWVCNVCLSPTYGTLGTDGLRYRKFISYAHLWYPHSQAAFSCVIVASRPPSLPHIEPASLNSIFSVAFLSFFRNKTKIKENTSIFGYKVHVLWNFKKLIVSRSSLLLACLKYFDFK